MANKSFLLVSMQDDKARKLAQVVSNESCRKILDYLAQREATESELAEKLNIPISTVHYNLKQLSDANLISADEFHYSRKGKEVNHYKLANKYIIIAPKSTFGIKEKLRSILPAALIVAATGFLFQFFEKRNAGYGYDAAAPMMQKAAIESASMVAESQPANAFEPNYFLITSIAIASFIILYFAFEYFYYKKSK